ncbi:MAG: peptidoglycan-associated lipoprotein Pal [Candidatus Krumholzibacteria bacterium]|nr:peptidoglycan-associated lipoprotein Pal [Candidatus Krumholzibacteria bacterium]MDH4336033.1 peptidoglycan-associated lipoprotein Pal [Candidatus Krumholzibacteria bacterium]MDH5268391.1 peptidoglycan-associated lipoprotein Pal [Candidatus Krumholzibacteria bacterium]
MIAKRLMWLLAVSSMVFVAGCGGKKAMDEPVDAAPAPVVEEPVEKPVVQEPVKEVSPMALSDAFFAFDSYSLSAEAKGTLEANAREMKRVTDKMITIEGHCDERGTKAYNLALGEKRANAARDYLVAMGVNASRITTVSYGKERPFDPGHDETAWAKNRRAHFVVK